MSEKVTSLQGRAQEIKNLGRKGARWAADNLESLCKRDALVPDKIINDRAADNWRSLLNIADQIGGEWPEKARRAALAMEGARQDAEPDTESRRLLADIRSVFRNHKFEKGEPEALKIAELIAGLTLAESPWRSYNRGKPISEVQFGRLLSPYGIQSEVPSRRSHREVRRRHGGGNGTRTASRIHGTAIYPQRKPEIPVTPVPH
jgi:putative DNA primase/helicase